MNNDLLPLASVKAGDVISYSGGRFLIVSRSDTSLVLIPYELLLDNAIIVDRTLEITVTRHNTRG